MMLGKIPWPPTMASLPPHQLPFTIHHLQHMHRMKDQLAGLKQSLRSYFTVIYHFLLRVIFPICNFHFTKERLTKFKHSLRCNFTAVYHFFLLRLSPFLSLLIYLLSTSCMGFVILKLVKVRKPQKTPKDIDMFFTAVSAATTSSMSTIDIEVLSNSQHMVLTVLMLLGGEVFASLLDLQFKRLRFGCNTSLMDQDRVNSKRQIAEIELKPKTIVVSVVCDNIQSDTVERNKEMKYNALHCLSGVVLGYLLVMHIGGILAIMTYIYLVSNAKSILTEKGLNVVTFSIFTTVSSFSNCGFLPTNENMLVFRKNLGLLLLVAPQSLLGGMMYPPALRSVLWFLRKITKSNKFEYILREGDHEIGYDHLFPWLNSLMLALTIIGILVVQFVAICAMEWWNVASNGLNGYEKLVNFLFLAVSTRHTGESTLNLSTVTPAIMVLFLFIMYLPPYTTFMPFKDERSNSRDEYSRAESLSFFGSAIFSHLSYLVIFVVVICITEREKISQDPLNFNIFTIAFEVISAYGNVGYSMGYSCGKRLTTDGVCQDSWTGLVGRWSTGGKVILIIVMFFGRLKRYTMRGGKAWKLS